MSFFVFVFVVSLSGDKDGMINVFRFPSRMYVCAGQRVLSLAQVWEKKVKGGWSDTYDDKRRGRARSHLLHKKGVDEDGSLRTRMRYRQRETPGIQRRRLE